MRKGLILLAGIILFLGINSVNAEEKEVYVLSDFYNYFESYIENYTTYKENVDYLYNWWEQDYKNEYPYYFIAISSDLSSSGIRHYIKLNAVSDNSLIMRNDTPYALFVENTQQKHVTLIYEIGADTYSMEEYDNSLSINAYFGSHSISISNQFIISENSEYDFLIPEYSSETLDIYIPEIKLISGSVVPSLLSLYDGSYIENYTSHKEINLNQYSYIALSLKDYSVTEQFYTNMYVKGQLCLTPVYNYGMTEKTEYYSSYQVQRCSSYYETFTLTRVYILADDLKNNAIYYLKAYDTTKENIVKVDTSVFDITYITEENKDNPYVLIDGKNYPTIAYDQLSSTATKSEDDDYIAGVTCQVGDFNCYNEYNPSNVFNDLFDRPLEMLQSVWGAILTIFALITEFIMLLPPTMQGFLYVSFGIAIILGVIKILL